MVALTSAAEHVQTTCCWGSCKTWASSYTQQHGHVILGHCAAWNYIPHRILPLDNISAYLLWINCDSVQPFILRKMAINCKGYSKAFFVWDFNLVEKYPLVNIAKLNNSESVNGKIASSCLIQCISKTTVLSELWPLPALAIHWCWPEWGYQGDPRRRLILTPAVPATLAVADRHSQTYPTMHQLLMCFSNPNCTKCCKVQDVIASVCHSWLTVTKHSITFWKGNYSCILFIHSFIIFFWH